MADKAELEQYVSLVGQLADRRATTTQALSELEYGEIITIAGIDAEETLEIAAARQAAEAAVATLGYSLALTTGQLQYSATVTSATFEANATTAVAGYDVTNIQATSAAQVAQIAGSATANSQEIAAVARVQAGGTASEASIQSATIGTEATIAASKTISIAGIHAQTIAQTASIDASQGIVLANIQAGETTSVAAVRVSELAQETAIRVGQYQADASIAAGLSLALAAIQVGEIQLSTTYQVQEIQGDAAQGYRGSTVSATIRAAEAVEAANLRAVSALEVAGIDAAFSIYAARDRQTGIHFRSDQGLLATRFESDESSGLTRYRATQGYNTDVVQANTGLQGAEYSADGEFTRRTQAAVTEATAREFGADRDYDGVVVREDYTTQTLTERLAYLRAKFELLLVPWQGSLLPRTIPGFVAALPAVSLRGVYSPSQVRQKLNIAHAAADAAQASGIREAMAGVSGRGASAASPSMTLERLKAISAKLRAVADAGMGLQAQLMAANAERLLKAQALKSGVFMDQQEAYTRAEAIEVQRQIQYLDDMTTIMGGL